MKNRCKFVILLLCAICVLQAFFVYHSYSTSAKIQDGLMGDVNSLHLDMAYLKLKMITTKDLYGDVETSPTVVVDLDSTPSIYPPDIALPVRPAEIPETGETQLFSAPEVFVSEKEIKQILPDLE